MGETDFYTVVTIAGMTLVTVLTRCFFFLSSKPWSLPSWAQRGLHYAPIAALAAVIVPEMVMTQGELIATWKDARIFAVIVGLAWFYFKRGLLGTIIAGMAVYLPLHVGLGW
jgi:branched-subunit amino acid transport protein